MSGNEQRVVSLLEASPVGIFQADRNGDIIFANGALRRLTGLQGVPSSSAVLLARVHPDDCGWVTEYWQRILRDGVAGMAAYRVLNSTGQLFWLQAEAVPILDRDGHATSFAVTVTDITAERELRERAERLSRFYDTLRQVNAAIMHCGGEQQLYESICRIMVEKGGITSVTVHRADLAGRRAILAATSGILQERVRRSAAEIDLDHPATQRVVAAALLTGAAATDNDVQNDERYSPRIRQSFREYHVGAMGAVPFTCFGETVAALSFGPSEKGFFSAEILTLIDEVGHEVSFALENLARKQQQRQAEEMLVRSEQRYSSLAEMLPVGVFESNLDGVTTYGNATMHTLTGIDKESASIQEWLAVIHPEDRDRLAAVWHQSVVNGNKFSVEFRYLYPDGNIVWAQATVVPKYNDENKLQCFIGVVVDVTRERQHQHKVEQLSQLYATLSQVNSAIVHCRDEQELYGRLVSIMVGTGGLAGASVYLADWPRRKAILAATAGHWQDETRRLAAESDLDGPQAHIHIVGTLLSGIAVTSNDAPNDERYLPQFRATCREFGLASLSTIVLSRFGATVAVLTMASTEKDFFSADILALLEEVGRDVSFALENFTRERQRLEAEGMLARSEENLRVTLRSIGDAVIATDTAGKVTMMNPVAEQLTGWSEAEASGRAVAEVFHIINEETRAVVTSPIDIVLRDGAAVALANHTILIARDGTERPIADSGAPIRIAEGGDIRGVVLVFRDQSEEHRMLKRLRESKLLYATLVEMLPVGVFESNVNSITTYSNPFLRKLIGIDKDQIGLDEWMEVIHPEDRDRLTAIWNQATTSSEKIHAEFRYRYPDGRIAWVQATLVPRIDDNNTLQGYLGAAVDVTREREQQNRVEQLSKLYATLSQVNSAIVHCRDEQELYDRIAGIMVETGGFAHASVRVVDRARRKAVLAATMGKWQDGANQYGVYQKASEVDLDDPSAPLIVAPLLTGTSKTSNDAQHDECFPPVIHEYVRQLGVSALSSVPFSRFGETVGVLTITSAEKDFFSADILALIDEIGRDVSFALENFSREQQRRNAEAELAQNEERLRLALNVTRTGMYEVNYRSNLVSLSAAGAQLMKLGNEAVEMDFMALLAMFPTAEQEALFQAHHEMVSGVRDSYTDTKCWLLPDGSSQWLRLQGALTAERDAQGKPLRLLGMISDVTEEKQLEERERLAATVFENSGESIMIIDANMKTVMVNQAYRQVTGYAPEEVLGIEATHLRSDRYDDNFYKEIFSVARRDGSWQGELWRRRKSGEAYPALVTFSSVKDKSGKTTHYALQAADISKQKEYEERINHLAYRDALTDLPNRTLLRDRVEQSIAIAHREQHTLAMLFLDLDYFKNINDSLGHAVGDRLLMELAQRLTATIREMDTVGRLGGDEFLLILPDADVDAAAQVAQKLLKECARPFVFESRSLTVTPSIGIALYPKDGENFDDLLKTADTAMYRAKEEGRNTYRFYTQEMNRAVFQRMMLETNLRRAIRQKELILHYQPKFELQQRTLVGIEALVRWRQPEMGMIPPAQFIPVAEESDLIEAIGAWVLEEACRQAKAWTDDGLPALRVAVNFSARQFAARNVTELVIATLNKTGLSGEFLEIEITESLLANDIDHTLNVLQTLKRQGVEVAIDDFGTGYSSLSYLKRFPIDRLKIDQSFIRDLVNDTDDRAIATAIVTLGHSLGMRVIAEGVETLEQMELLRKLGCDEVQGYYMGRPIPADEMTVALRKFMARPSRET